MKLPPHYKLTIHGDLSKARDRTCSVGNNHLVYMLERLFMGKSIEPAELETWGIKLQVERALP
jgi:hypothetical protein